ncbi:hypothetical protein FRB90_008781, partial [Tulasnella sp. 427]
MSIPEDDDDADDEDEDHPNVTALAPATENDNKNIAAAHTSRLNSSDSDMFVRMNSLAEPQPQPRPRALFKDFSSLHATTSSSSSCSGCGSSYSSSSNIVTLSNLQPCNHAICHQCFTGMLNIVGEKGLECPLCKSQVTSFDVRNGGWSGAPSLPAASEVPTTTITTTAPSKTKQPTLKSKQKPSTNRLSTLLTANDVFTSPACPLPVLRIDNLPWDVTPQMLTAWLRPTTLTTVAGAYDPRIHILLERSTGKTLSHCFVELPDADDARRVLRECQNKIIGSGKRTRAVSVTVSTQEEVMRNVFQNWRGGFASSLPTFEGLDARQAAEVLKAGLVSYNELDSLLQLMQNPESHFLKVPTLPFYALISILQKLPAAGQEADAMMWTSTLRDRVFAAVQILSVRVAQQEWDPTLLEDVLSAAFECQAFTDVQRRMVSVTAQADSPDADEQDDDDEDEDEEEEEEEEEALTPSPTKQVYVNDLDVGSAAGRQSWGYSRLPHAANRLSNGPTHDDLDDSMLRSPLARVHQQLAPSQLTHQQLPPVQLTQHQQLVPSQLAQRPL